MLIVSRPGGKQLGGGAGGCYLSDLPGPGVEVGSTFRPVAEVFRVVVVAGVLERQPRVAGGDQVVIHLAPGVADVAGGAQRYPERQVLGRVKAVPLGLLAAGQRLEFGLVMSGQPALGRPVAALAADAAGR